MVKTSRKKYRTKVRKPNRVKNTKLHYVGPNPELFKKIYDPKKSVRENYRKMGLAVDLTRVDFVPKPGQVTVDEEGFLLHILLTLEAEVKEDGTLMIENEFGPDVVFEELEVCRPEDAEEDDINEEEEEEIQEEPQNNASEVFDALFPKIEEAPKEKKLLEHETEYWKPLLLKYGTNYELMARDMKLNYYQESVGVCKRKCGIFISTLGMPVPEKKDNNTKKQVNPPPKKPTTKSKRN